MSQELAGAEADVARLIGIYRTVTTESQRLPAFSLGPYFRFTLEVLIAYFGLFVEIVLIPYNLLVLVLRLFKVRWRYIIPFSKRVKYAAIWLWRGELGPGALVIRPMVRWQIKSHAYRRLTALSEAIYLAPNIADAERFRLIEHIDRERKYWQASDLTQLSVRGTLPTLALAGLTYAYNAIPDGEAKDAVLALAIVLGVVLSVFAVGFFIGSIPTKRGLFLGRPAKSAVWPGGVDGAGYYAEEREILEKFGVRLREFPLDFFVSVALSGLFLATISSLQALEQMVELQGPFKQVAGTFASVYTPDDIVVQWITFGVSSVLWVLVIVRRHIAQRL
jgi:hypothetical protein